MKILDSQGRLFGKVSILDSIVALVMLMVIASMFVFSGISGSVAQVGAATKPIELEVIARWLNVRDPQVLLNEGLKPGEKAKLMIHNQPAGEMEVRAAKALPHTQPVPQPDGSLKEVPEPKTDQFNSDILVTLAGRAQVTSSGVFLGKNKLKISSPIELEGSNYNFNTIAIGLKIGK
jgi:hypothetical protein